jgi:hypothetical protein
VTQFRFELPRIATDITASKSSHQSARAGYFPLGSMLSFTGTRKRRDVQFALDDRPIRNIETMPIKQMRAAESREQWLYLKRSEIDSKFDIQVEGKIGQVVMLYANQRGRKIVEDLWPDVEWTDENFSPAGHSAEWLFTDLRVTRLPPLFEEKVPLRFCGPDELAVFVACVLYCRAWPLRVACFTGHDRVIKTFGSPPDASKGADLALYAEYVPPSPRSASTN